MSDTLAIGGTETPTPARHSPLELEQDRWVLWSPVFLGAGIAVYFLLPNEPNLISAIMPLVAAFVLRSIWRHGVAGAILPGALLSLTLGLAAAKIRTETVRAPILGRELRNAVVTGFVQHVEPRPSGGPRITLLVTSLAEMDAVGRPRLVRIRIMKSNTAVHVGHHVQLRANLSPPPRPAIPGGYDFARWAYFRGIGAVGFALASPVAATPSEAAPLRFHFTSKVEAFRQAIGRRVQTALPGQTGALANALITGERGGIPERVNEAFRASGLYHLLSISGLHMAVMGGFVFYLARLLLALVPILALRYPIKKWAAAIAIVAGFGYLLISGGALATVRSFIMISVVFAAILLDRPAIALRNVALAALLILTIWPESLLNPGFQMSFAAVTALISSYEALRTRWLRSRGAAQPRGPLTLVAVTLGGVLLTTLIASLAVAPFAIYHFHHSQQYALLANLLAVPLTNFAVMPAAFMGLLVMPFGLESGPLLLMGIALDIIAKIAEAVSNFPGASVAVPAIPNAALVLVVLGGLWLTIWRRPWRMLGLVAIATGFTLAPMRTPPDILVGADARQLAFRGKDGELRTLGRGGAYELQKWLESDGDPATPKEVARRGGARCDSSGCVTHVRGRLLAFSKTPRSLSDDCNAAQILVLPFRPPRACVGGTLVVDRAAVRKNGIHALYLSSTSDHEPVIRVETVDEARGERPWVSKPHR